MTDTGPGSAVWRFPHRNLGEHPLPDGTPILRPSVVISPGTADTPHVGVVDSGSPITVADPAFVASAGIDIANDRPLMEIPLGMGASFDTIRMYQITMALVPPDDDGPARPDAISWNALVGARKPWRHSFAVLLGQRGWFDFFPTTIDARATIVQVPLS